MQAAPASTVPASPLPAISAAPDDALLRARVEDAAQRFEGLFIHQMLKAMRRSSAALAGEGAPLSGAADLPLLDLADQLVADQLAGQRAFGIADLLLRQLLPAAALKPPADRAALSAQGVPASGAAALPPPP